MKPQNIKPLEFGQLKLKPGAGYCVVKEFRDYDRAVHSKEETWSFLGYDVLPYDDGYTLYVSYSNGKEGVIRMQERAEEQQGIIAVFEQYVALAQQGVQRDGFAAR